MKELYKKKTCVILGIVDGSGAEYARKYAAKNCSIAFMDLDKSAGCRLRDELERRYGVRAFFFHGDAYCEEDMDIFIKAVKQQFKYVNFCFYNCWNWPYVRMLGFFLSKEATVQCIYRVQV